MRGNSKSRNVLRGNVACPMGGPIYFTSLYRNLTLENAYTHKNRINLSQKVAQRTFFNFWRRIKTLNRNIKLELKELWDINLEPLPNSKHIKLTFQR